MSPAVADGGRWLIYALGGGLGHLTRAIALARVAQVAGRSVQVLTNSPFAASRSFASVLGSRVSLVRIDPALGRDSVAARVCSWLEPCNFDVLIVDTFPRGLGGELAPMLARLSCPKVLVHRDLNPAYVEWADLRSVAARYDLLLLPGEDAPMGDLPNAIRTRPWLLRDRSEILDRAEARLRLKLSRDDRPAIVVMGCGRVAEINAARRLAERLETDLSDRASVRFASIIQDSENKMSRSVTLWPLVDLMAGIDVLVGSGGYNTVHEARATATPLVALAQPRKYDRQAHRLSLQERASDETEVLRLVSEQLARRPPGSRVVPFFENGVHAAVQLIDRLTAARQARQSSLSFL
jgi:hypothetical protein